MSSPTPLPEQFTKLKFHHELVKRVGNCAIYKRWHENAPSDSSHFEIIEIRAGIHPHTKEFREYYPGSTQWGQYGWTEVNEDAAKARFRWLQQKVDQRVSRKNTA